MQARIHQLINALSDGMYEREHLIALSLLAGIAGLNTFLYGPPGTAKSLISRRIALAFKTDQYFEYLLNRFSMPDEIFGPVSIQALKQDQYIRKTQGYLPTADVVFLDEIWKASPAILNTLLTLINEKTFKNGDQLQTVPLKVLMSASNEIPALNQGLDALYDRFILRLAVTPIQQVANFHALLQTKPNLQQLQINETLKISTAELEQWRTKIYKVELPTHILQVFDAIRVNLQHGMDDPIFYVSDRRWQRIAYLVKAVAFLCGRQQVLLADLGVVKHCLWHDVEDIAWVSQAVEQAILNIGLASDLNIEQLILDKEQLELKILNYFYYTDDVYESYLIAGKEYLRAVTNLDHHYKDKVLYLELNKMDSQKDFFAVDAQGEEIRGIVCNFNGTRQCTLKGGYYGLEEVVRPYIKYQKGSSRQQLDPFVKTQLFDEVTQLTVTLTEKYQTLQQRFEVQAPQYYSDFIESNDSKVLLEHLQAQIQHYALQLQDCTRLEQLCKS